MKKTLPLFLLMLIGNTRPALSQQLGLKDFLKTMYDVSGLPSYISDAYSAEVSTYDRTGQNDDGFAGTYSYLRINPDSSLVIFDVKGKGLINRIWTPTPSDDSLDFYIDDSSRISFTICYRDLFSGKVYPFIAPLCANQLGGYYCYLPIPFNQSCKIVFRGKRTRFHQIGYRLYKDATSIKKFSLPLSNDEEQSLIQLKSIWGKQNLLVNDLNKEGATLLTARKIISLAPGQTATIFDSKLPGRIAGFEIQSTSALAKIAKLIDIKITWDDEKTAAIYCPMADYFGYAFGKASMKSLLVGSDGENHYSYFPMPFDKSAKIELLYKDAKDGSKQPVVNLSCNIFYSNKKRVVSAEGKFYANWIHDNPVPMHEPHSMLDIKGRGHFVGTVLQAQGLKAGMTTFFEGDDSTVVDGELRMHGTGSEDFFNGGWYALLDCWDAAMSLPLSGALDYSVALARTGGYRLFINDKISFNKSFYHSIEHGPEHNEVPADYTSVSYYYADQPNIQTKIPVAADAKMYMPDTLSIYPQLINMAVDGDAGIKTNWEYARYTGGMTYHYTIQQNTILRMSLQGIPVGNYHVYLDYIKSPEAAKFALWQRQTPLSGWIQASDNRTVRVEMQNIADLTITQLNNTISFRFSTTEKQNQFVLNRIILIRQ